MSIHDWCIFNCGGTDCHAPDRQYVPDWDPNRIKELAKNKIKRQPFYKIKENADVTHR